jgi:hypothetical protein
MFAFWMAFLPFLTICLVVPAVVRARKYRVQLLQERARHDKQRFLRMGFLRRRARREEQGSLAISLFRKGEK